MRNDLHERLAWECWLWGDSPLPELQTFGRQYTQRSPRKDDGWCHAVAASRLATSGHAAKRTNILRNAESIILEADSTFLREMIEQPKIVSALPSQTKESMSTPRVRKGPLKHSDVEQPEGQ